MVINAKVKNLLLILVEKTRVSEKPKLLASEKTALDLLEWDSNPSNGRHCNP